MKMHYENTEKSEDGVCAKNLKDSLFITMLYRYYYAGKENFFISMYESCKEFAITANNFMVFPKLIYLLRNERILKKYG